MSYPPNPGSLFAHTILTLCFTYRKALRIFINQEFDEMKRGLRAAFEIMGDGGRLGVLTVRFGFFVYLSVVFCSLPEIK